MIDATEVYDTIHVAVNSSPVVGWQAGSLRFHSRQHYSRKFHNIRRKSLHLFVFVELFFISQSSRCWKKNLCAFLARNVISYTLTVTDSKGCRDNDEGMIAKNPSLGLWEHLHCLQVTASICKHNSCFQEKLGLSENSSTVRSNDSSCVKIFTIVLRHHWILDAANVKYWKSAYRRWTSRRAWRTKSSSGQYISYVKRPWTESANINRLWCKFDFIINVRDNNLLLVTERNNFERRESPSQVSSEQK